MEFLTNIQPGVQLHDRFTGFERKVSNVESFGPTIFLTFEGINRKHPYRQVLSIEALKDRFEIVEDPIG